MGKRAQRKRTAKQYKEEKRKVARIIKQWKARYELDRMISERQAALSSSAATDKESSHE